jgi:hypothetical protein
VVDESLKWKIFITVQNPPVNSKSAGLRPLGVRLPLPALGGLALSQLGHSVFDQIIANNVFGHAAVLAFYFLLALFPLILIMLASYGLFECIGLNSKTIYSCSRFASADCIRQLKIGRRGCVTPAARKTDVRYRAKNRALFPLLARPFLRVLVEEVTEVRLSLLSDLVARSIRAGALRESAGISAVAADPAVVSPSRQCRH